MTIRVSKDRIDMDDKVLQKPVLKDYGETVVTANSSTSYTVDLTTGNVFNVTLTGNCTFTFSNPPASGTAGSFTLILTQDATGGRTVIWPGAVAWPGGANPTLYSIQHSINVFTFTTTNAGTTWYGMEGEGNQTYEVNAVNFDGTNDYLTRGAGLTGATDTKTGTFSFWFKKNGADGVSYQVIDSTGNAFTVLINGSNKIRVQAENVGGTVILQIFTSSSVLAADVWHHFIAAWSLGSGIGQIYLDDVSDIAASPTLTDDTIDYTIANWGVGGGLSGTNKFNGDFAEVWFATTYLDISISSNRRKFIDALGRPVNLGSNGSTPTGTAPIIYQTGATATWHTNSGSGGGFTENGELTDAATSPSD